MPERAAIAKALRERRRQETKSQGEYAAEIGISRATVSLLERQEENPTMEMLQKLAGEMPGGISYLLGVEVGSAQYSLEEGVLARKVKEVRQKMGQSQEVFAAGAGISVEYLSKIERGEANPSLDILQKIAAYSGVTVVQLFSEY